MKLRPRPYGPPAPPTIGCGYEHDNKTENLNVTRYGSIKAQDLLVNNLVNDKIWKEEHSKVRNETVNNHELLCQGI